VNYFCLHKRKNENTERSGGFCEKGKVGGGEKKSARKLVIMNPKEDLQFR